MAGNASLIQLTLRNYRSMGDSVISFASGVTVLAGQNGAGKTSTIDALETLLGNLPVTSDDRSNFVDPTESVTVDGEFQMSGLNAPLHFRAILDDKGFRREIKVLRHKAFSVEPADMPLPALRKAMEDAGIASPGGSAKEPYVKAANEWIDSRPGDELVEEWRPASRADMALLPALTRFDEDHAEDPAAYAQTLFTRAARQALAQPKYGERLAELAADVQADVASTLDELRSKIRKHCPDIDDVNVVADFDFGRPTVTVSLELIRNGAPIPLATVGEGRRRRMAIAIHEASIPSLRSRAGTEILAYDEPDTHLDYLSQRELFDVLQTQAEIGSVQVLVATHSVNFIDRVSLDSLVHCRLDKNFQTVIETLRSTEGVDQLNFLQSVCSGLGLRNSALLSERSFLVVEGDTEEAALPSLYRTVTKSGLVADGVTVLNTRGSGAIKLLVEVMRNEWKRDVVVLTDSDARGKIEPWLGRVGLVEGRDLFFVGSKEFEDAFSDEQWAGALQHSFRPAQGAWTPADIAAIRSSSSFGDDLCTLVRARCPAALATKPDLGYALSQYIGSLDAIPVPIRMACEAAQTAARS